MSIAAVARHRSHIAEQVAEVERETGLRTVADVQARMAALQTRVEKLAGKLARGKDHRATIAAYRECREGLRIIVDVLATSDLAKRLERLESHATPDDDEDDSDIDEAA